MPFITIGSSSSTSYMAGTLGKVLLAGLVGTAAVLARKKPRKYTDERFHPWENVPTTKIRITEPMRKIIEEKLR